MNKATGKRIREFRKSKQLSIVELARMVDVSKSLISQVERGDVFPSLSTLEKIALALEVDIAQFFKIEDPLMSESAIVVRGDQRKTITMPNSPMIYHLLTPNLRKNIEFLLIEIPPNTSQEREGDLIETFRHEGEEYFFVLEGQLELIIGDEKQVYSLTAGDSGCFDASNSHIWRNNTNEKGSFIIAATIPKL